jgi:hypothetical protein
MDRRTSFITAIAITGVALAGSTAIAANIGILNAADSDNVGELSAAAVTAVVESTPTTLAPQITDVYLDESASTPVTTTGDATQQFAIEDAGTVNVVRTGDGVRLDGVDVNEGWTWTSNEVSPTEFTVMFTNGESVYVFDASVGLDGQLAARVDEQIINVVETPAPSTSVATGSHEDEEYESDDHDDEEDEDEEHEGGEDDD